MKMVRNEYLEKEEEAPQIVEKQERKSTSTIRSKAVHFVSDLTTGLLNPISDKPSKTGSTNNLKKEDVAKSEDSKAGSTSEDDSVNGPDTSSFPAFIYSLLSSSESRGDSSTEKQHGNHEDIYEEQPVPILRDSGKRKSLFSKGKSLGKSMYQAAKLGVRYQYSPKGSSNMIVDMKSNPKINAVEGPPKQKLNGTLSTKDLPETSESSFLLSDKFRRVLYAALPVLVQGRKWVLLYSTWKHGISLSTLYRRSILWPGPSLLVVGDRNGTVFGGLVEAPLKPSTKRGYQGSNSTFVFSNIPGHPAVYRATGANRYYTLCSTDHLALGGGSHFALFLDGDLLNGSSSASETYGNPCLAQSKDFEVKEVELWGFVYASQFEEIVSALQSEAPGEGDGSRNRLRREEMVHALDFGEKTSCFVRALAHICLA